MATLIRNRFCKSGGEKVCEAHTCRHPSSPAEVAPGYLLEKDESDLSSPISAFCGLPNTFSCFQDCSRGRKDEGREEIPASVAMGRECLKQALLTSYFHFLKTSCAIVGSHGYPPRALRRGKLRGASFPHQDIGAQCRQGSFDQRRVSGVVTSTPKAKALKFLQQGHLQRVSHRPAMQGTDGQLQEAPSSGLQGPSGGKQTMLHPNTTRPSRATSLGLSFLIQKRAPTMHSPQTWCHFFLTGWGTHPLKKNPAKRHNK